MDTTSEEQNDLFLEKPPSPVLSNSKISRKLLHCRRIQIQKKSRVKLTNRFAETTSSNLQDDDSCGFIDNETTTLTQSLSQSENLLNTGGLIEKIGANILEDNESPVKKTGKDFEFKKPESPVVNIKKLKEVQGFKRVECSSFKTAGGKNIKFTDDVMKRSRKLFDDILCPGNNAGENSRQNKYAFLSKREYISNSSSITKKHFSPIQKDTSELQMCLSQDKLDFNKTGPLQHKNYFIHQNRPVMKSSCGFSTASGKGVLITEAAYNNAFKKFVEEMPAFKSTSDDSKRSNLEETETDSTAEMSILSTQETNLLFSEFTLLDDKNENISDNSIFKGFSTTMIEESIKNAKEYKMTILNFSEKIGASFRNNYKISVQLSKSRTKIANERFRKISQSSLSFSVKSFSANENKNKSEQTLSEGEQSFVKPSYSGFSTASGNKIPITESLLSTAKNKFGEDLDCISIDLNQSKKQLMKKEVTHLNTQLLDELLCDFPVKENIVHGQFKGFLDNSIESSRKKSEMFASFFGKWWDNEEILLLTINSRSPLQELYNQTLKPVVVKTGGFITASGNRLTVSKSALDSAKELFKQTDYADYLSSKSSTDYKRDENMGFKTAGGKSISVSEIAISRAQQRIENIDKELESSVPLPSTSYSGSSLQRPFKSAEHKIGGFSTASGNRVTVSKRALDRAQQIFKKTDEVQSNKESSFHDNNLRRGTSIQTITENSLSLSEVEQNMSETVQIKSDDLFLNNSSSTNTSIMQDTSFGEDNINVTIKSNKSNNTSVRKKKRLGTSPCKPINIPKYKIEQAMKLFEHEKLPIMSPIRTSAPFIYNSTPLKGAQIIDIGSDITPIKNVNSTVLNPEFECTETFVNDRFIIQECTKGTIDSWSAMLENEKSILEMKMKLLSERQECLRIQKHLMANKHSSQQRRHAGILFNEKQSKARIPLQSFTEIDSSLRKRVDITPRNAELLHFNYAHQNVSIVQTLDGACIVPNTNNSVGLSEIETAFKIMDGVDPKLIPNGWIRNHFKWIVWKLASYENFTTNMQDCLTLENAMQQLKYRYDREIDRAERSTLRKIFEMDDAPQKRMVLCVSNIFNLQNGQFELELTDGWYGIRTVIDEPLCKQVARRKVQIGTKLMTYGAELLNCEGCHPLEATDLVRFKINCNSTRRTRWYAKLGYQRCPEPFPLKLNSVYPNGGVIGCVKIFVARVYPVKYMEKQNKLIVWRNRKAEELRAQEWENKCRQDMEKLKETIARDYEMGMRSTRQSLNLNLSNEEIRNISCTETLFSLCQNSKDPERLQEILTSSQRKSITDYQQRLSFMQQQEISRKIEDRVSKLQLPKRDVSSVLQLLVLDVLEPSEKTYVFQIWRPLDIHLETLKESSIFNVYNILPSKNGGLSTMNRTRFQPGSEDAVEFLKYKRTLLEISKVTELVTKPLFNEFDTVGVVVALTISDSSQNMWLADSSEKLLFVKIFEGPKTCLLLNTLKVGQIVAASNLIFCKAKDFGEAIANHLSVISCYPQQMHLQEGISALNKQLPNKDLEIFLDQCKQKVSYYVDKVDLTRNYKSMSSRSLVQSNSLFTSDVFDDSSDVLYSMIDVDKFV